MLDIRIIIGRLTKDPEVKEVSQDLKVARFTLACDGDFKDKDGNRKTEFVDTEAWRASAEFAENYLGKGRLVCVVGRMKTDEWEDGKFVDEQGNPAVKRKGVLTVDKIYPLDKPAGSDDPGYETPESGAPAGRGNNNRGGNNRGASSNRGGYNRPAQNRQPAANQGGNQGGGTPIPQW